jgi:alanyl-tRNA synthetase
MTDLEVGRLVEGADAVGPYRLVRSVQKDREPEDIQRMMKSLLRYTGVIAMIGLSSDRSYLTLGVNADVSLDASVVLEKACKETGGKGGGSATLARWTWDDPSRLTHAMTRVYDLVVEVVS